MTRKEIQAVIDANAGKALYIRYGDSGVMTVHHITSKTAALKNAKAIHSVRVSTYQVERPDLDPKRYNMPVGDIVTFDATATSGKTLEDVLGARR